MVLRDVEHIRGAAYATPGIVARDRGRPLKRDRAAGDGLLDMAPTDPTPVKIPYTWVGYDELPILYANQFLVQYQQERSFVLGIGQGTAPPLIGSPEEIAEQIAQIEFVPIKPLLRIALTEEKARELLAVLQASLDKANQIRDLIDPRGVSA